MKPRHDTPEEPVERRAAVTEGSALETPMLNGGPGQIRRLVLLLIPEESTRVS